MLFRLGEAEVDRIDHRRGGAVVGAQRIVAPGGGLAGAQVGVNVGPAESVDRLLGVANHEKALRGLVGFDAVNALENAVLQRIGVLELVDHRHRELLAYALGQSLAAIGLQGGIEALQKIVKTQLGAALFLQLQRTLHMHQGVAQQQRAQLGGGGCGLFARVLPVVNGSKGRMLRRSRAFVQLDARLAEGFELARRIAALAPGGHLGHPAFEHAGLVFFRVRPAVELRQQSDQQGLDLCPVFAPQRTRCILQLRMLLGHFGRMVQQTGDIYRFWRRKRLAAKLPVRFLPREHALQGLLQGRRRSHDLQQALQGAGGQAVELLAPIVLHHLGEQLALVGDQGLLEQAAAVKSVLAQHAVAPAVNGGYRRLIHPIGGFAQQTCATQPLLGRVVGAQRQQQGIGLFQAEVVVLVAAKQLGRFSQALANAVAQLLRGGVGKGDHQNLGRHQRPVEGLLAAMVQHQAQVQRGDGIGFASAGAGLDQAAAPQRKTQGLERLHTGAAVVGVVALAHACSWPLLAASPLAYCCSCCACSPLTCFTCSNMGPYSSCAVSSNPAFTRLSKLGKTRARSGQRCSSPMPP